VSKILDGLRSALDYARCNHMWLWEGTSFKGGTRWRCERCGCRKTEFSR
jgi:hypothetical protein